MTNKLKNNLTKCVKSKLPTLISFSILEIFLSLLDKLRKRCHKFRHIFQLSQSCEQEDFNRSNKFVHLTGAITEKR